MADTPAFSIIVPVYNNALELERCLRSIRETSSSHRVEIIVVDDCSPDDGALIELATERYQAHYQYLTENVGPGAARNQGALLAKGDILIFIDADCVVSREWISRLTKPIRESKCMATTSCYCGPVSRSWLTVFQDEDYSYRMPATECDAYFLNSCNFAIDRQTFLSLGGFPLERVGEDARLGITLAECGKPARYLPDVGVFHSYHRSLRGYVKQRYSFAFQGLRIVLRYDNSRVSQVAQKVRSYNPARIALGMFFALLAIIGLILTGVILVLERDLCFYFALSALVSLSAWAIVHGRFFLFLSGKQGVPRAVSYLFLQFLTDAAYLSAVPRGLPAALFSSESSAASERDAGLRSHF